MAHRIPNYAPVGSLLKAPRVDHPRRKVTRSARVYDPDYLAMVRLCPCIACGQDTADEAAHVRTSSAAHGKPMPGMGVKPDDRWSLPLCHGCHMEQHNEGELTFWHRIGISPIHWCAELYKHKGDLMAMRAVVMRSFRERVVSG